MRTVSDREIVEWIGRLGAAGTEHVAARFELDRRAVEERLVSLQREELLEGAEGSARRGMYWASATGLAGCGLERLGGWQDGHLEGFEHAWQVAQVAVELMHGLPDWSVLSAREIAAIEAESGERFASVDVGFGGLRRVHVPTLVLSSPGARIVPVEVQPALGMDSSLLSICRSWGRARHVNRVYWLAELGPGRAVRRIARKALATDRITVLGLDDVPLLVASEAAREEANDALL
jgi:hypothetical protein